MEATDRVDANPTKAFFVRMITKDIALEDCVLDLIDNSIDGALEQQGGDPVGLSGGADLSKYQVEINATPTEFSITDNCGGITKEDALKYAFTFGRKDADEPDNYSIGVYGIGMKRAVFKLGNKISIRSTYAISQRKSDSFRVPIDVSAWLEDEGRDWDFAIEPSEPLKTKGVEIVVKDLKKETSEEFANSSFVQKLRRTIERDYSLHIRQGLSIKLNGEQLKGWSISLLEGGSFEPLRVSYPDNDSDGKVEIEIVAGMAATPPDNFDPDESSETDNRHGWYVVCNGRIVLAANKDTASGWGTDGWPQWHPQYAGFIGIIVFTAKDASLLPLNTTKRSVDPQSGVFRRARPRMREATKEWIKYTNARKQALEDAKRQEKKAKPTSIFDVKKQERLRLPEITPNPKVKTANIAYSMPLDKVRGLASALGQANMTYRDVGIGSFDYAYNDLVGEE